MEFLHQEVHQVRQADPAFAGVEDGLFGDRAGVYTGRHRGDLFRGQQLGVVANGLLVGVPGFCDLALPGGVPHEATPELQPFTAGVSGEERPVPVNACHPQLVIRRGAFARRVEPGQRAAGGFAGQALLGQQGYRGALAEKVDGGGYAQDAASDDGNVLGGGHA
ncbi:hypothetical protein D3C73_1192780 [compost metagenome]